MPIGSCYGRRATRSTSAIPRCNQYSRHSVAHTLPRRASNPTPLFYVLLAPTLCKKNYKCCAQAQPVCKAQSCSHAKPDTACPPMATIRCLARPQTLENFQSAVCVKVQVFKAQSCSHTKQTRHTAASTQHNTTPRYTRACSTTPVLLLFWPVKIFQQDTQHNTTQRYSNTIAPL